MDQFIQSLETRTFLSHAVKAAPSPHDSGLTCLNVSNKSVSPPSTSSSVKR